MHCPYLGCVLGDQQHQHPLKQIDVRIPPQNHFTLRAQGKSTKIDHIPKHKEVNKFQRISIIQMFSEYDVIKLKINRSMGWEN